jgi:hypothetical protein
MSRLAAEMDGRGRPCTAGKELEARRSTSCSAGPPWPARIGHSRARMVLTTKLTTNQADNRGAAWTVAHC